MSFVRYPGVVDACVPCCDFILFGAVTVSASAKDVPGPQYRVSVSRNGRADIGSRQGPSFGTSKRPDFVCSCLIIIIIFKCVLCLLTTFLVFRSKCRWDCYFWIFQVPKSWCTGDSSFDGRVTPLGNKHKNAPKFSFGPGFDPSAHRY